VLVNAAGKEINIDYRLPRDYLRKGTIEPAPTGEGRVWVRFQSCYDDQVAEAAVDEKGEFKIYEFLTGCFILSVRQDERLLDLEEVSFPESVPTKLPPKPINIRLPKNR
jgi:hypothetical protein